VLFWRPRCPCLTENTIASVTRTETTPSTTPIAVPALKKAPGLLGLGQALITSKTKEMGPTYFKSLTG